MQTDQRGQHGEELFVDKNNLSPLARAPGPWHSTLVPHHEPSTRAIGLRHDVFYRIGPPKMGHPAISPGSSALRSQYALNPRKSTSCAFPSNGDPSTRHFTSISRLALKPVKKTSSQNVLPRIGSN